VSHKADKSSQEKKKKKKDKKKEKKLLRLVIAITVCSSLPAGQGTVGYHDFFILLRD
jgi:cell division protein FtsB